MLEIAKTGVQRAILLQKGCANEDEEEQAIHGYTSYANAWMNQQLEALGGKLA
ncbi:MAG: hypothetical protein LH647_20935 [Leptolyngbyaceae cyanobacterium CAN_BIN12]|nr:hypothetical protein [Leptolyngbyaceae cyanobacterium CAN_BIN12]